VTEFSILDASTTLNLWFSSGSAVDLAALQTLAPAYGAWVNENLMEKLSVDAKAVSTTWYSQESVDAAKFIDTYAAGGFAGRVTGPTAAVTVRAIVKFSTGGRGKTRRGRSYVPGVPEGYVQGRALDSGWLQGLVTAFQALNGRIASSGFSHSVVSKYINNAPRPAGVPYTVTFYAGNPIIGTQRRSAGQ